VLKQSLRFSEPPSPKTTHRCLCMMGFLPVFVLAASNKNGTNHFAVALAWCDCFGRLPPR
jgi:hypothetical protein